MSHFLPGHLFCQRAYVLRSVGGGYCFTYPCLPCGRGGGSGHVCVPPETAQLRAGAPEKGLPGATALIQPLGSCPLPSGLAVPDAPEEAYTPDWSCTSCEARKGERQSLSPSKEEIASPAISFICALRYCREF